MRSETDTLGQHHIVLVTGMSGAGKTSALGALADHGYEAIDNPPISTLSSIASLIFKSASAPYGLALGVDARSTGFSVEAIGASLAEFRKRSALGASLIYLDCEDDVLLRRFKETRRRHPLAHDGSIEEGMAAERARVTPLRDQADTVIDTTNLSLTELRSAIAERFAPRDEPSMAITIMSFGYKRGVPREADIMFDARFLANPYWQPSLREMNGLDEPVAEFIAKDPQFADFFERLSALIISLIPAYRREGKSYLCVAIGCTGGHHRSVMVVDRLSKVIEAAGYPVRLRHRDLPRAHAPTPAREVVAS